MWCVCMWVCRGWGWLRWFGSVLVYMCVNVVNYVYWVYLVVIWLCVILLCRNCWWNSVVVLRVCVCWFVGLGFCWIWLSMIWMWFSVVVIMNGWNLLCWLLRFFWLIRDFSVLVVCCRFLVGMVMWLRLVLNNLCVMFVLLWFMRGLMKYRWLIFWCVRCWEMKGGGWMIFLCWCVWILKMGFCLVIRCDCWWMLWIN